MTTVAVLAADAEDYMALLEGLGARGFTDPDLLAAEVPDAEVLLADPVLAARVVGRLPRLRWVQSTWAGVEALVDVPGEWALTRVHGVFGPQMREYVFGYLLLVERGILGRLAAQGEGRWLPADHGTLARRTLGVVGTGSIGSALAEAAGCLGMRTLGWSRSGAPAPGFDRVRRVGELAQTAGEADHLVVVLPATVETRHVVGDAVLAALPTTAVVVNVGRGSTVDTGAVVRALRAGRLRAAVLDVLEEEPLGPEDPLWQVPNLFITSHTAAVSRPEDVVPVFVENLGRLRRGEPLAGLVDRERGY